MALYLKEGSEESNIRGLVETCAHNDDIKPLVKLVFEAQALADTPPSIVGAYWPVSAAATAATRQHTGCAPVVGYREVMHTVAAYMIPSSPSLCCMLCACPTLSSNT